MRQGELLALRWRDVDLKWKTIQVQTTLDRYAARSAVQGLRVIARDGETVHARGTGAAHIMGESNLFAPPKSKGSRRQIQLSEFAVKVLRGHQACQVDERMTAGDSWSDLDLVFPNQVGRPLDPSNIRRREFHPLLAKAGLPRIRFHDLCHTAATLLLQQRVNPKIVSEMLGHASICITLDLYSHALPDIQQESADAMDRVFGID
jgi:integrase